MHTCAGAIGTVPILLDESDKTPELGIPVPSRRLVLCRMFVERMRHDTLLDVPSHPVVSSTTQEACFPLRVSHLDAIKSWRDPLGLIPSSYNIKQRQTATYLSHSCDALCADDRRCTSRSVRVILHAGLHSAKSMPCVAHGHLP
jgi:hypothetical protein